MIGIGYVDQILSEDQVGTLIDSAFAAWDPGGKRVLLIIPDSTRSMPMPLFFRLFHQVLSGRVKKLDVLIALGTHPQMSSEAICKLLGITEEEQAGRYASVGIFNHHWDRPETFATLGTISAGETHQISEGRLSVDVPVRLNRMILDYDLLVVCGPVFPHEVVGFSGGDKYFFPGISGPEVINFTHWLGALITSYEIIGVKHTPVRDVINRAASLIPTPRLYFCPVVKGEELHGLYVDDGAQAWSAAADLSARVHIRHVDRPYRQVLSHLPSMYDDIWTGAKGMYKLEPVIAAGGEVIIYAPHIDQISYTHGRVIKEIGYHVRDYFVKQWESFKDYPWGVLAHSTHLRGIGTYEDGVERPRIQVTLATGIPRQTCEQVCLGYRDPDSIDIKDWQGREAEGILYVPHAGETLYRLKEGV